MPTWIWIAQALASDPSALVANAVAAHPTLDALHHTERALRARARVAGAWPDPLISVEYSNAPVDTWTLSDHPMSGVQLRVEQQIRPARFSTLSREVGRLQADASAYDVDESALALALAVRRTFWTLTLTRQLRTITTEHLRRTEELLAAVSVRYETGTVGQHAVLRLQLLRDRLTDELADFETREVELVAALQQARATDGSVDTPADIAPRPPPTQRDWRASADAHRPRLKKLRTDERAANTSAQLARIDARPEPTVWAGYRVRTVTTNVDAGTDFVSFGIGIPVPTGSARSASGARAAALARSQAARATYTSVMDEVVADMQTILARWVRARDKANVYTEQLIPAARAALHTTQSDFTVGRAEFASLFDGEVALLDLERARIAAAIETHLQHAEATAVLGAPPEELL